MNIPTFPKRIEIELVNACNLNCIYCPRRFLENLNGYINFPLFKRLIDEIEDYPDTILVLHRRGESLLHPDFIKIMEYVHGKFKTIQLASNATLLNEEKSKAIVDTVSFISFSIDTPEMFNKTRIPAKYDKVESNILNFLKINERKGNPVSTQVSMVKTSITTEKDTQRFKAIWCDKVDCVRIYQEHSSDGNFGSLKKERTYRKSCVMPYYEMLIYCDGKTGRCNHDWDGKPLGDITKQSIIQIWHSDQYNMLRLQHKTLEITDPICLNCGSWYPSIGNQGTGNIYKKTKFT